MVEWKSVENLPEKEGLYLTVDEYKAIGITYFSQGKINYWSPWNACDDFGMEAYIEQPILYWSEIPQELLYSIKEL